VNTRTSSTLTRMIISVGSNINFLAQCWLEDCTGGSPRKAR